ncbi:hypothetical protein HOR75_gp45 [Shewanella phage SppYZU05]|uniref:Uncharacterized protein n=1 Tax=Shewanella phage SppYZU05 TaxID=1970795 RepID=A0A1W6JTH7_9CAUD|nr:hypothetical protein HOR75_gp45 [Shewanella phage SppYZU05]ARM70571.1 hypothetical protein SppYZU05_45 [Shewanella phage SppYZU05]
MLNVIGNTITLGVSIANVLTSAQATCHVAGGLCRDFLLVSQLDAPAFRTRLSEICGGDIDIIYLPRHDPSFQKIEDYAADFKSKLRKAGFNAEITDANTDYEQCRLYGVVQLKVNDVDVDVLIYMENSDITTVCNNFDFRGNAAYATNDKTTGEVFVNATSKFWDAYTGVFQYEFAHPVVTCNQVRRASKRLALWELVQHFTDVLGSKPSSRVQNK